MKKIVICLFSACMLNACTMESLLLLTAASAVPLIGGVVDSKITAESDKSTISAELRGVMKGVKKMSLISEASATKENSSDAFFAQYMETKGGIETSIAVTQGVATPSARRKAMNDSCGGASKPEVSVSFPPNTPDLSWAGVFIGRAFAKINAHADVLQCKTKKAYGFDFTININQGIYGVDQLKIKQKVAEEGGKVFLSLME